MNVMYLKETCNASRHCGIFVDAYTGYVIYGARYCVRACDRERVSVCSLLRLECDLRQRLCVNAMQVHYSPLPVVLACVRSVCLGHNAGRSNASAAERQNQLACQLQVHDVRLEAIVCT